HRFGPVSRTAVSQRFETGGWSAGLNERCKIGQVAPRTTPDKRFNDLWRVARLQTKLDESGVAFGQGCSAANDCGTEHVFTILGNGDGDPIDLSNGRMASGGAEPHLQRTATGRNLQRASKSRDIVA